MPTVCKVSYSGSTRRITLPKASFDLLKEMILEIWPGLPEKFALKQKDNDGDEITIATQRDLTLALEHTSKSLKLTIVTSNESKYKIIKTPPEKQPKKVVVEKPKPSSELYSVWVGGLAQDVGGVELKKLFQEKFRTVISARVKTCPVSGRSRRYGFVEFLSRQERDQAINDMDGANWGSTFIRVRNASPPAKNNTTSGRRISPSRRGPSPRRDDIRAMELHRRSSPVLGVPGEVIEVTWIIQNSGNKQWPVTHLTIGWASLPPKQGDCEVVLPKLLPGKVAFATARFPVPKTLGEYKAGYQHIGPNGEKLGLRVTAWIKAVDEKQRAEADQTSSDFRREVAALNAMGYKDNELIEHLLVHNNHDVNKCAKWLDANFGEHNGGRKQAAEADKRR
mmetsp:Transcript_17017/g.33222  ORF Transcript_17017/g.33222 Transcript_17017/m.33222 type:complete len:394 (+) Transcript_17017:150-1331(+)